MRAHPGAAVTETVVSPIRALDAAPARDTATEVRRLVNRGHSLRQTGRLLGIPMAQVRLALASTYDACRCGNPKARNAKTCRACYRIERRRNRSGTTSAAWQRARWLEYRQLLATFGETGRSDWQKHRRELAARQPDTHPEPVTSAELRLWWLDRFTLDEIRELAAGLTDVDMPVAA